MVDKLQTPVTFVETPEEAVKDANFVFAGCRGGMSAEDVGSWRLDAALMSKANPDVRLLLSASPVDQKILSSPASWLVRQAEYRLRVHKRILHWVFLDNESPA